MQTVPDDFTATRRFGDASVTVISEGTERAPLHKLLDIPLEEVRAGVPDADASGDVVLAFTVAHVRLGGASVLIDAGMGPRRDGGHARLTPGIEAGLAQIGVAPEEVATVVLTHAHWDHVRGA